MTGAVYSKGKCLFSVWAPFADQMSVCITSPIEKEAAMVKDSDGIWRIETDCEKGWEYKYRINGGEMYADPASFYQPNGPHEASAVVDHDDYNWEFEKWDYASLCDMVIYELHIGTFTDEGTFEGAIQKLGHLCELGVNAVEVMPICQFPGGRNWGYDGVYPYAVQNSYGGVEGFKRFVDACHGMGMAVILDVVYNHLGPEGNYLEQFGPYFTDRYKTPWGKAINFDDCYCDAVRNYFIDNAIYWFDKFRIDGLRLDAVHAIYDHGAYHIMEHLADRVESFGESVNRKCVLIAESDLNDSRYIRENAFGGYGLDGQWSDDFHHSVHSLLTGESNGFYGDFGEIEHFVRALNEGYVYSGQYSDFRKRRHGNRGSDVPSDRFVVCTQNHDQVGNRLKGERLISITDLRTAKLSAGLLILSPYVPLIFMGQEFGARSPFLYFVSHTDEDLVEAVREGRKSEFRGFGWDDEPADPQGIETFERSKINWGRGREDEGRRIFNLYKELLKLRREKKELRPGGRDSIRAYQEQDSTAVVLTRTGEDKIIFCCFNFGEDAVELKSIGGECLKELFDSNDSRWSDSVEQDKSGAKESKTILEARSFKVFEMEK